MIKSFAADGVFRHGIFRLGTGYQPDTLVVTANRFEQPRAALCRQLLPSDASGYRPLAVDLGQ